MIRRRRPGLSQGSTVLMVASTGGHLTELAFLSERIVGLPPDPLWVTFDLPQTTVLLDQRKVTHVPYIAPRDPWGLFRALGPAWRVLSSSKVDTLVTTGAGIALAFVPLARLRGKTCHYIECATRQTGPSLTGELLAKLPGVRCYTQAEAWASGRWHYAGSTFERFIPLEERAPAGDPVRVVVTLGTQHHPFRSAVEGVFRAIGNDPRFHIDWQVGHTPATDLIPGARSWIPPDELRPLMRDADLVIAHAGIGSALDALALGKQPLLLPRSATRGEHVDDHQGELAAEVSRLGLATSSDPTRLTAEVIEAAVGRRVGVRPIAELAPVKLR